MVLMKLVIALVVNISYHTLHLDDGDSSSECTRPGQLRLVNGAVTDGRQGRVEICFKGQWGSICQNSWDYYDTEVACRQLGLGTISEY